eukprot:GHVS01009291.1.p1 GENE.GHVS01009291.1~~GHVS01009291.1.p1  ORF type:complete len:858 (+),score=148.41 GHVS01009291.1:140-2713(+)
MCICLSSIFCRGSPVPSHATIFFLLGILFPCTSTLMKQQRLSYLLVLLLAVIIFPSYPTSLCLSSSVQPEQTTRGGSLSQLSCRLFVLRPSILQGRTQGISPGGDRRQTLTKEATSSPSSGARGGCCFCFSPTAATRCERSLGAGGGLGANALWDAMSAGGGSRLRGKSKMVKSSSRGGAFGQLSRGPRIPTVLLQSLVTAGNSRAEGTYGTGERGGEDVVAFGGGNGGASKEEKKGGEWKGSKRSHVLVKLAMDANGHVDDLRHKPGRFTSLESLRLVQMLRDNVDVVLTGINTVLRDDCRLTVRKQQLQPPQQPRYGGSNGCDQMSTNSGSSVDGSFYDGSSGGGTPTGNGSGSRNTLPDNSLPGGCASHDLDDGVVRGSPVVSGVELKRHIVRASLAHGGGMEVETLSRYLTEGGGLASGWGRFGREEEKRTRTGEEKQMGGDHHRHATAAAAVTPPAVFLPEDALSGPVVFRMRAGEWKQQPAAMAGGTMEEEVVRQPLRVVVDSNLRITSDRAVLNDDNFTVIVYRVNDGLREKLKKIIKTMNPKFKHKKMFIPLPLVHKEAIIHHIKKGQQKGPLKKWIKSEHSDAAGDSVEEHDEAILPGGQRLSITRMYRPISKSTNSNNDSHHATNAGSFVHRYVYLQNHFDSSEDNNSVALTLSVDSGEFSSYVDRHTEDERGRSGSGGGVVDLNECVSMLENLFGVESILVESGPKLCSAFIRNRLADKVAVIQTPHAEFGDDFASLPANLVWGDEEAGEMKEEMRNQGRSDVSREHRESLYQDNPCDISRHKRSSTFQSISRHERSSTRMENYGYAVDDIQPIGADEVTCFRRTTNRLGEQCTRNRCCGAASTSV